MRKPRILKRICARFPPEQRFWRFVQKGDGCWLWQGYVDKRTGYGKFGIEHGHMVSAHRFMWETVNGPIPAARDVCHHCDVRACVRPDHLFVGTRSDNMRDMYAKGRGKKPVALLRACDVLGAAGGMSRAELIATTGVGGDYARRALNWWEVECAVRAGDDSVYPVRSTIEYRRGGTPQAPEVQPL